jgi:amidase
VAAYPARALHPDCQYAVEDAAKLCESLGHEVVIAEPPVRFADLREQFMIVWSAGVSSAISSYAAVSGRKPSPRQFEEVTWWLYEEGQRISAARYLATITQLQLAARRLAEFYEQHDVSLSTVTSEPAPRLGILNSGPPVPRLDLSLNFVADTPLANLTGQPAMSVPLHETTNGLPVGVHFVARIGDEATLLALATELERARPWHTRVPRIDRGVDVSSAPHHRGTHVSHNR